MLATSAPTVQRVHVRQATTSAIHLNSGVRYSVSYCTPFFGSRQLAEMILPMVNILSTPLGIYQIAAHLSIVELCSYRFCIHNINFCDVARAT